MTEWPGGESWPSEPELVERVTELIAALEGLSQAAAAVVRETGALARWLEDRLPVSAQRASIAKVAPTGFPLTPPPGEPTISLQDSELRRRYYAGLPPRDEDEAAFQRALRESERFNLLAQGMLLDDEADDP